MFFLKKKTPLQWLGLTAVAFVAIFLATLAIAFATRLVKPQSDQTLSSVVTNKGDSFNVYGEATIETEPDEAQINLGIESQALTVKEAQDQMNAVIGQLTASLKELGVADNKIQTTNYNISPNYDWSDNGNGRIIGYRASTSVNVTVTDFNLLNQAIDAATQVGVNQIYGIQFTLSEAKQTEIRKQARTEAIQNAKENAQELSTLTGMQLGKIIDVQENIGGITDYGYNSMAKAMAYASDIGGMGGQAVDLSTGVNPGATTYNYSVTLSYQTN